MWVRKNCDFSEGFMAILKNTLQLKSCTIGKFSVCTILASVVICDRRVFIILAKGSSIKQGTQ